MLTEEISVLLRLILAHVLTDFVFQPTSWISDRNRRKHKSVKLYLHAGITAIVAYLLSGLWAAIWIPVVIFVTHLIIDIWKSRRPATARYFLIDQFAHLLVIGAIWLTFFNLWTHLGLALLSCLTDNQFLATTAGYLIVTWPLGILIGIATERWRNEPGVNTDGLAKAGMWIGFFERFLIFTFILIDQYTAIGFLIAAKSVLRFNDKENSTQKKTEYVLIGTLMSFSASLVLGLFLQYLCQMWV